MRLTKAERCFLEHAAHCERFGWRALSGRVAKRGAANSLVAKGLLTFAGQARVVDGDGYALQPERYRDGWELTDAGRAASKAIDDAARAELERLLAEVDAHEV